MFICISIRTIGQYNSCFEDGGVVLSRQRGDVHEVGVVPASNSTIVRASSCSRLSPIVQRISFHLTVDQLVMR